LTWNNTVYHPLPVFCALVIDQTAWTSGTCVTDLVELSISVADHMAHDMREALEQLLAKQLVRLDNMDTVTDMK